MPRKPPKTPPKGPKKTTQGGPAAVAENVHQPGPIPVSKAQATRATRTENPRPPSATDRVPPAQSQGVSGVVLSGGKVISVERDTNLTGAQRFKTLDELIINMIIVGAAIRYANGLIGRAEWEVEDADDSTAAKEHAELVRRQMDEAVTTWQEVVQRQAMFAWRGSALQEMKAGRLEGNDKFIAIIDVCNRPMETIDAWDLDRDARPLGVIQRDPQTGADYYIPRWKLLYTVDGVLNDSPEGTGMLRQAYEQLVELARLEQLEMFAYETNLRGIPIGRLPYAKAAEQIGTPPNPELQAAFLQQENTLRKFIDNHIRNPKSGLLLDSLLYSNPDGTFIDKLMYDLQLVRSEGQTGEQEINKAIDRKTREIARLFGVEHLLVGDGGKGSLALAVEKNSQAGLLIDMMLRAVGRTANRDYLGMTWMVNKFPIETRPKLKPDAASLFKDAMVIADVLETLMRAGLDPRDPVINQLRNLMGAASIPEELIEEAVEQKEQMAELAAMAVMTPDPTGEGAPGGGGDPDAKVDDEDEGKPVPKKPAPKGKAAKRATDVAMIKTHIWKEASRGVMVALMLPEEVQRQVVLAGGEPARDLHITLAYLGKDLPEVALERVAGVVYDLSMEAAQFPVALNGVGRFCATPSSDGKDVIYLSADSNQLSVLRERLCRALEWANIPVSRNHGYSPHVTLAYVGPTERSPIERLTPTTFMASAITLAAGDNHMNMSFKGKDPLAKRGQE